MAPLHYAVRYGHVEVVKLLVECGAGKPEEIFFFLCMLQAFPKACEVNKTMSARKKGALERFSQKFTPPQPLSIFLLLLACLLNVHTW